MSPDPEQLVGSLAGDAGDEVAVRRAATVMLVRDAERDPGLEVFMLRRVGNSSFAAGMYVFPGGRVDDVDGAAAIEPYCTGLDDRAASAALGIALGGGLAYWVAAVRECFEESGLLLARAADGGPPTVTDDDRRAVHAGELSMVELCRRRGLVLDLSGIRYVSHWVTPRGEGRRFDARFFLALAPHGQDGVHDDAETDDSCWVRPADAIARWAAGELLMLPPTIANLRSLESCPTPEAALDAADAAGPPPRIEPKLRRGPDGRVTGIALPGDADFGHL